ncbi:MAG: acetylglutamate kinase [Chloroflexi bacterium]|nr:acetylglutamate kinase [Chloroflexota bacterium]
MTHQPETLPIVIKVGGNDLDKPGFIDELASTVAELNRHTPCIVVHGGGQAINRLQKQLGIEPVLVNGQRVTDEASLDVAEMVLSGGVNTQITLALLRAGVDAQGMSGVDRGLLQVEPWSPEMGRVGRIVKVRAEVLLGLCAQSVVPVISPISMGPEGRYNVNADHAAGAIAAAIKAAHAAFVTNVPGVKVGDGVAPVLTVNEVNALIAQQVITGGMIPKVQAALDAVSSGAAKAIITDLAGLRAGTGTIFVA